MALTPVAAFALYGAGVASSFNPCVLPLVPGYLVTIGAGATSRPARAVRLVAFAGGTAVTFAALGAVVGVIGWRLTEAQVWTTRVAGVALIVFGLLGVAGHAGRLGGEWRPLRRLPAVPLARAALLGVGCGAAWTPCVGPLLGAALTAAGTGGSPAAGAVLLGVYALGVLTPFAALAVVPTWTSAGRKATRFVPAASSWGMVAVGLALAAGWYSALVSRALA